MLFLKGQVSESWSGCTESYMWPRWCVWCWIQNPRMRMGDETARLLLSKEVEPRFGNGIWGRWRFSPERTGQGVGRGPAIVGGQSATVPVKGARLSIPFTSTTPHGPCQWTLPNFCRPCLSLACIPRLTRVRQRLTCQHVAARPSSPCAVNQMSCAAPQRKGCAFRSTK